MKINKLFLGLIGLSAMMLASCSDKDDYQWATASGEQVYFSNTLPTKMDLSRDANTFTIPVSRVNTSGATTASISLETDTKNTFSVPASVSFDAGSATADLTITYEPDSLAYDAYKDLKLTITDTDKTNAYGYSTYTVSVGIPSPYVSIGKGTITDNFWFEASATVTIMQNTQNPNEFRIMAPFEGLAKAADANLDGNQDPYIQLTVLQPGDNFYNVDITQENLVGYTDICTGYFHSSYEADIYMLYPGRFTSMQSEDAFAHNVVVEWQENGLPGRIQLAPYFYMFGVGGWNNSANDDVVVIDFPGYAPKDLTIEAEYMGVLTDVEGTAKAAINLTLGADATDARAVVVSADADDSAVADAVEAGELEAMELTAGNQFIPIPEDLTGKLKVVLMVLDEGVVKTLTSLDFEYYGGGANPWEVQATGDYVYTQFFGSEEEPATDEGLELQYNAEEDAYRITHWGYNVDFTFVWDKETNAVSVPEQFTGYVHSSYGEVYVAEADDIVKEENAIGPSYYDPETLTLHFHVAYYVEAGVFGAGDETFTLTPAQARRLGLDKAAKANTSMKPVMKRAKKRVPLTREQLAK